jgi:hypothetical protein
MKEFINGTWKHCDDTYTIMSTNRKGDKIIIEKSNRFWYLLY